MIIAQIRNGKVTVLYGTDPRNTGFTSSFPPDVSLVDASDIDGIEVGWSAAFIGSGRWAFAATQADLDAALASRQQPAAVEQLPAATVQPQDAAQEQTSDADASAQ
jgi:hypothetical protein